MWAAAVLADGTMATGDAGGGVSMWDARLGTRIAAFSRHTADVLALAASPDGSALFAAGVDSQVVLGARAWSSLLISRHLPAGRVGMNCAPPSLVCAPGGDALARIRGACRV